MYFAFGIAKADIEVMHAVGTFYLGRELPVCIHRACAVDAQAADDGTIL